MKNRFFLSSLFLIACTGLLQATSSNPSMSRVYGDQFTAQVADTQNSGTIGALNTTFGTNGSLAISTQLSDGTAQTVQVLSDGSVLVALSKSGSDSVLAKYNSEGTVFSSGYGSAGVVALGNSDTTEVARAMIIDSQGRALVAGGAASGSAGWLSRVTTAGVLDTTFNTSGQAATSTNWQFIAGLAQQTSGEIIAVGFNGTNAQIARYTLAGALDTTFGDIATPTGFTILNGSTHNTIVYPTVGTGLYSVYVDANNKIYLAFVASAGFAGSGAYIARFTAAGVLDTTFNSTGYVAVTALNSATSGLYLVADVLGNLIVGAQVSANVIVAGVTSTGGAFSAFTTFNTSIISSGDTFSITGLTTTSNNKIFITGSDTTTKQMAVIRLMGASGLLDKTTNDANDSWNTTGYNLFSISSPSTTSIIQGVSIAPNGLLYTVGSQTATTVPYISVLYNDQYVSAVAQSPATVEQGNLDLSFGNPAIENYAGVTTLFNGMYGSSLMQQATSAIEITNGSYAPVGDILVGMSGLTNANANSSMMLSWLTQEGTLDTSVGSFGYSTLTNAGVPSGSNEYLTGLLQGANGIVYISGYCSASNGGASLGSLIRSCHSNGDDASLNSSVDSTTASGATLKPTGLAVGSQAFHSPSLTRILLFCQDDANIGHISGYTTSLSSDTTFGKTTTPGYIYTSAYTGLKMGPLYGGVVHDSNSITVAYVNSDVSGQVDVASFAPAGEALEPAFGSSGIVSNLFTGGTYPVAANNVRTCFNEARNIIVAATSTNKLLVAVLNFETGALIGSILVQSITGATSLSIKEVTGVSDGTILVTFWDAGVDKTMYVARLLAGATGLDTTFDSQGAQPGVLSIKVGDQVSDYNARILTSALVQSTAGVNQGNIVMAGYESVTANDATPMVMRSFGTAATTEVPYYPIAPDVHNTGTFDVADDLLTTLGYGGGKVVFVYPTSLGYNGMILVGIDNGTDSKIARYAISGDGTLTLDTATVYSDHTGFAASGIFTISGKSGINSITIDKNNNILVGGTATGAGWAYQLTPNGTASKLMSMPSNITGVNQILQQKSGRYIIAASGTNTGSANIGILVAFQDKLVGSATNLAVDPTFNPNGTGAVTAGQCSVGLSAGLYSIAIDTDDTIAASYVATSGSVATLGLFTADGDGYSTKFNISGSHAPLATTISADSSSVVKVAFDDQVPANIVVAASTAASHQVQICRYVVSSAAIDGTFNGGVVKAVTNLGSAGVTLASMMQTTLQQTVFVGYNTAQAGSPGANGNLFACRLAANGSLDLDWNQSPIPADTQGVLTYSADSAVSLSGAAIDLDGEILSVGSTSATLSSSDPIITFVYGTPGVTALSEQPQEAAAGTLDLTIPGGATGAMALAGVTGVPKRVYVYNTTINGSANGAMLVASTDATHAYVTLLNADLSLTGTYSSGSGFGTSGVISLTPNSSSNPTATTVTDLYVANGANDTTQPIYIAGYTTISGVNTAFAYQIASTGTSSVTATPISALSATTTPVAGCIRQSTNSKVFVSGYNGTSGVIAAYDSAMTALDTSFGNHSHTSPNYGTGYYATGVANGIYAMATDSLDRIYIAYKSSATTINVQRLMANGTTLDTTFGTNGTATFITGTAYSATQIRMVIDLNNNMLVVAAQDGTSTGNIIQVARFDFTGTQIGAISTVTIASNVLNLSDLFIDNDSATNGIDGAYPNIYVVGYNSTANNTVVARISTTATTIALDTTYATTGIANVDTHTAGMSVVTAGALDPDRRVYVVGSNGSTTGYIGRLFGDYYWTQASPAISQATIGTIDLTLSPNNTGGIDLEQQTTAWNALAGYSAHAIIENPNSDGTSYIAFGNGTNLIVGQVNADMIPVSGFGTSGLTTALAMATVSSIAIDASGNIIVAGLNSTNIQKVVSFTSAGVLNATFADSSISSTLVLGTTTVAQQKSGRYIVGAYYNGVSTKRGIINAYQNESAISGAVLPVDATFGPAADNGYYLLGDNAGVDDLCIDSQDYIYFTYIAGISNKVYLGKLTADGSGLVNAQNSPTAFNSGAVVDTGITNASLSRIAINSDGNILVGATTTTPDVKVALFNGSTGLQISSTVAVSATNTPKLTKLVGSGTEFYGSIWNSIPAAIAFAVTSDGVLDTSFGTSGLLTTTAQAPTAINGISVQADGKVVMVGSSPTMSTIYPILIRGYGYPYVDQFAQAPDQAAAGTLDTTLWPTIGALNFETYFSGNTSFATAINDMAITRVYEAGNGVMTFLAGNNTKTTVFRLLKDLTLDTSFNNTGYYAFGSGLGNPNALYVDSLGNIYFAGNYSGASWAFGMTSAGAFLSPSFSPTILLATGKQIVQQQCGRMILAGQGSTSHQTNTNGYLAAYTNSGALDASFATGGQLDMTVTTAITDIAVDSYDNIIAVSNNSGTVVLQKVTATGSSATTLSAGTAITTATSGSDVKVILDASGDIVVAAATSSGFIVRSYVNNNTGTNIGFVTLTVGSSPTILSNIYATSDSKVTLIGYNSSGAMIAARLLSASGSLAIDATFGTSGVLVTTVGSTMNQFYDAIIHADDRIMVVGSASSAENPYMARIFGDNYVTYDAQGPTEAKAGTIDTTFGSDTPPAGFYNVQGLSGITANSTGQAILAVADGGYYMALNNGTTSQLIRTVASGALDVTYNASGIAASITNNGVNSMMMDGSSRIVLTGTTALGHGWIERFVSGNSGAVDTTFGTSGIINLGTTTQANVAIEQSLARLVVAGTNSAGNGALFAYTSLNPSSASTGVVDTTFNATSLTPGAFTTGIANGIYTLVADQYDRLIFASLNAAGNAVDLYRLTPTGELDATFGSSGKVAGVIANASSASQIRVALDSVGNIVVAAQTTASSISNVTVVAYDNGTSTTSSANGLVFTNAFAIPNLVTGENIGMSLTALITSADGKVLVLGNQLGTTTIGTLQSPTWIARLANTSSNGTYALDTTFNPSGNVPGIFEYSDSTVINTPYNVYNAMVVDASGRLGVLGYEETGSSATSVSLIQVFDTPYTTETVQSPDSKTIGTNDLTFGASSASATALGITFFGITSTGGATYGQVARAVALQDDNNIVVAIDGANLGSSGASQIYINMFDNDGILNSSFGTAGQATALSTYANQNVQDMVTFTTTAGVHKAILAGYVSNATLGSTDSLLLQYNLSTPGLDSGFGGYNGNPAGIAFGDGKQINTVGRQTSGRIIAAGITQDATTQGLLLGYTSAGKLDMSFANDGYLAIPTATALYTHTIDSQNRVVVAYRNSSNNVVVARYLADGSGLDTSFNSTHGIIDTGLTVGSSGDSFMRVAVDSSNNVYVAVVDNTKTALTVNSYAAADGSTFNSSYAPSTTMSLTAYSIARLLVDVDYKVIIVGYDVESSVPKVVITRIVSSTPGVASGAYSLDTTFNPNGTQGYLKYAVAAGTTTQLVTDAMVHPDGRILVVGAED